MLSPEALFSKSESLLDSDSGIIIASESEPVPNQFQLSHRNTIGNINICSDKSTTSDINQSQTPKFKDYQDKTKMETVNKLRQFGLGDEQIAEALGLTLDEVKQVDSED